MPVAFSFRLIRIPAVVAVAAFVAGCSKPAEQPAAQKGAPAEKAAAASASAKPAEPENELPPPSWEAALPEELRAKVSAVFTGDLDEAAMRERRVIRAGVTYNRSFYFVDKGVQRGLSYEYLTLFEEHLNKALKTGNLKIHVVPLPMPRDMLIARSAGGPDRSHRRAGHAHAGAPATRGFHGSDPAPCERSRRHRTGGAGVELGRRPVREDRVCAEDVELLLEPSDAQPAVRSAEDAPGRHPGGIRKSRRRRSARDGECGAHPGRRR